MSKALQGQVQHSINFVRAVEATRITVTKNQPLTVKKGPAGRIGTGKGIGDGSVSITFAQVADREQFNGMALPQDGPEGFTYCFQQGNRWFMMTDCHIGTATLDNDPGQGDTSTTMQISGSEPIPTTVF